MTLSPQKFREIVFQVLYSQEMGQEDESLMTELMMNELAVSKKNVRLAQERVKMIREHLGEIDPLISSVSTTYDFDRIQFITKNILRLGVFELFFDEEIPPKVAIAEGIRLSRKFNTPESAAFVNAVLDQLYQQSLGKQLNVLEIQEKSQFLKESEDLALEAGRDLSIQQQPIDPTQKHFILDDDF